MQIQVIGKSPAWQDAGGACSGYLVEHSDSNLLLDCGNGVFGKLRAVVDFHEVSNVLISHMHGDHILDLIPFAYGLLYGPGPSFPSGPDEPSYVMSEGAEPQLHLPPGGIDTMRTICGAFGSELLIEEAFSVTEYDPAGSLTIGELRIDFQHVPHFIDAWAVRIAEGDSTFVFGADCGPSQELCDFATGADLLMLEATFAHDAEEADGHMTPTQAATLARDANAARLVLTHISDCLDLEASQRAAAEIFGDSVIVAADGDTWQV